jgi:hypothetical protein
MVKQAHYLLYSNNVYLASTGTHADHDVWLIDSGASFHMTHHSSQGVVQ